MIKPINVVPAEQLYTPAIPVKDVQDVKDLVQDLLDTASSIECFGLAANQIWERDNPAPAVFVAAIIDNYKIIGFKEYINPIVTPCGPTSIVHESCLSVPKLHKKIKRHNNVEITYTQLNGVTVTEKLYGAVSILSTIIQHEYDHLLGKVINGPRFRI